MLLKILALLNNFIKYSSTILISTQNIYEFKTRETLDLLRVDISIVATNNVNDVLAANFAIAIIYLVINNTENNNISAISLFASYQSHHIDTKNVIAFAALRIKKLYNKRY